MTAQSILLQKVNAALAKAEQENFDEIFYRYQMYEAAWKKACDGTCRRSMKFYYDAMQRCENQLLSLITLQKTF